MNLISTPVNVRITPATTAPMIPVSRPAMIIGQFFRIIPDYIINQDYIELSSY